MRRYKKIVKKTYMILCRNIIAFSAEFDYKKMKRYDILSVILALEVNGEKGCFRRKNW